jgi:hypothetical protein
MMMEEILTFVVVVGMLILPVILVPVVLHFRHERWKVGLDHERQLRAIELGRNLTGEMSHASWFSPLRVGLVIGAGVPVGAFLAAMVTSITTGFHDGVWLATAIVSLGSVISGAVVAACATSESKPAAGDLTKQSVDEDAYDVVSSRGSMQYASSEPVAH